MRKISVALLVAVLFAFTVMPCSAQQADKSAAKPAATEKAKKHAKATVTGKLNINTATAEQVAQLPGVSPKKAQGLIDYRTKNGNFKNFEDLQKIPGIQQKKINKLKDFIIFEGETTLKAAK